MSANRRWAKESVWISSQLTDESGTKCLHGIVCLSNRCCIWVSDIVYVWTDVMHVSVRTHGAAPPLSECVCLSKSMPQWKCVCVHSCQRRKSFAWSPTGGLEGQSACLLEDYGWSFLFHSLSEKKKPSHWTFCPLRKILHHSHHAIDRDDVCFLLKRSYQCLTHHWCSFVVYMYMNV